MSASMKSAGFAFALGPVERPITGNITTLCAINGFTAADIERRIGYHNGRLNDGFCVLLLTEKVSRSDFVWHDQTRYSGGSQIYRDEGAYVPRIDLLRGALLVQHGNDKVVDEKLLEFYSKNTSIINQGVERRSIVKVIPNIGHDKNLLPHLQYPNSDVRNIVQWDLVVGKKMECIAQVSPKTVFRA